MYIPEFWCGFIAGAIAATVGIIGWVILYNRRRK